ncbi:hypothetical protein FHG87_002328 [Trinorchestia longiramus]|nr:hypothetical protein FHG87_002328 [Trinorchestia longiramus]
MTRSTALLPHPGPVPVHLLHPERHHSHPQFSSHGPHGVGEVVVDHGLNPLDKIASFDFRPSSRVITPRVSLLSTNFLQVRWMVLMWTPMVLVMVLLSTSQLSTRAMTTAHLTSVSVNEISGNSVYVCSIVSNSTLAIS